MHLVTNNSSFTNSSRVNPPNDGTRTAALHSATTPLEKGGLIMRALGILAVLCCMVLVTQAQMAKRTDAIWARTATTPITLDGVLNESAWAVAESVQIVFGQNGPIPGSGWKLEQGKYPTDPTRATVKFLVVGDSLYVGVVVKDKSVGGGLFNAFDGFLMNIRRKEQPDRPTNAFEYFYGWVTESWACGPSAGQKGALPCFLGFAGGTRTDSLRKIWDAVTTVQGVSNSDSTDDVGYTTEFKFNLAERGYKVSQASGDIVMYNISIYDADYQWPMDSTKFSGNRTWLQGPWGNASSFDHLRIWAKPSVTTSTNPLPEFGPDLKIPNGQSFANPVIDGKLNDQVWQYAPSFKIKFGDAAIRNSYQNTGPFRSGQYQPQINGSTAPVLDPSVATVKYFYKGDTLYLGFDVNDQVVQYRPEPDRYDGFRITFNDRSKKSASDSNLYVWNLRFFVNAAGTAGVDEDTPYMRDSLKAVQLALALKGGTTVDTLGTSADSGYTAEIAINLAKLGYPTGRGDGIAFFGVTYYDGDSFSPASGSYATRTWWFRENSSGDGPAWAYLDPGYNVTTGVGDESIIQPEMFALMGNYPNPFNPSTVIRYTMPEAGTVTMVVYDVLGRKVASLNNGFQTAGVRQMEFNAGGLSSGTYFYYLELVGASGKNVQRTATAKMTLLK